VLHQIGYPQFEYHPALDHNNTISEDNDFCKKAINAGFSIWCDPTILCGHIGSTTMHVEYDHNPVLQRLKDLHDQPLLPADHVNYLWKMKENGIEPKVIYDIGACVLHWTNRAKEVWPEANIVPIEAMKEVSTLYVEKGIRQWVSGCLISDKEETVEFYENLEHPGGNSMYKENSELSPLAEQLFPEENKVTRYAYTLDSIVKQFELPAPDMIKMDIQGAELKALKGAQKTLETVEHLILELQHADYNFGAPKAAEVIEYLESIGFKLEGTGSFCGSDLGVDGDYHFVKTRHHQ
jgi:FkbM family methyltransferase